VAAHRRRTAVCQDEAPGRRPFSAAWQSDLRDVLQGRLVFLRRTTATGAAGLLGRTFAMDSHWVHCLVWCEADLNAAMFRFYALRRREPTWQPLLQEVPYTLSASRRSRVTSR
jgi:hypothetical protein